MRELLDNANTHRILVLLGVLAFLGICCGGITVIALAAKLPLSTQVFHIESVHEPKDLPATSIDLTYNKSNTSIIPPSILQVDPTGRYLINDKGDPVLLVGDAAWSAIAQLTTSEMDTYLEDRAARGFNFVLVNLIEHLFATNAPKNVYGDAPFTGANFTTPNEAYFKVADYFIQKAASLGIYVLLAPTYLGYPGTEAGWDTEVAAASLADMQTWGEFCGKRYKDYDNIVWVINGDRSPLTPVDFTSKLNAFTTGLNNYDKRHLITTHNDRGTMAMDYISDLPWQTLNSIYFTYLDTPGGAIDAYAYTPTIPFFDIEAWYENSHSMTAQGLRAQVYWTVLEGGVGHVFGNNPLWKFAYDGGTWTDYLDTAGANGMTHFGILFNSIAWYSLAPDTAHEMLTSGYGTIGRNDYAGAAIDAGGTLAVIYMPSNRTMTVDVSKLSGPVTARWYDPTDGSYITDTASPIANSGTHNFSRSSANARGDHDWVLMMSTQNPSDTPTPPPTPTTSPKFKEFLPQIIK